MPGQQVMAVAYWCVQGTASSDELINMLAGYVLACRAKGVNAECLHSKLNKKERAGLLDRHRRCVMTRRLVIRHRDGA